MSAQSRTVMMIIPLPHYGNNFAISVGKKKMCRSPPPSKHPGTAPVCMYNSESFQKIEKLLSGRTYSQDLNIPFVTLFEHLPKLIFNTIDATANTVFLHRGRAFPQKQRKPSTNKLPVPIQIHWVEKLKVS